MDDTAKKIQRRLRRIEATVRWSRMKGFNGHVPGALMIEYAALKAVAA